VSAERILLRESARSASRNVFMKSIGKYPRVKN
jgi:hypothetical protein